MGINGNDCVFTGAAVDNSDLMNHDANGHGQDDDHDNEYYDDD